MTRLLVHAIAERPVATPPQGLRGGALVWIEAAGLGAWASVTDDFADALTRDDTFDHHRIVALLCDAGSHLPVRFPTLVDGAAGIAAVLAPRAEELRGSLARLAGRAELAVTLLWRDAGARPGRGHADVVGAGPGRTFLERKRLDLGIAAERRERAEALAQALVTELAVDRADVRHAICPSAEVALSTAILAPAGRADELKEAAIRVASGLDGVRAVVSGPWPPYTFAGAT